MKVFGTLEIQICEEEISNLKYSCPIRRIMDNLYLVEKNNIAGLLFDESNSLFLTFQEDVGIETNRLQVIERIKQSLGQVLFFDYDYSSLKYWMKA